MVAAGDGCGLMTVDADGGLLEIHPSIASPIPTSSPRVGVALTNVAELILVELSATNLSLVSAGMMVASGDGCGLMTVDVDGGLLEIHPSIASPIPTPSL